MPSATKPRQDLATLPRHQWRDRREQHEQFIDRLFAARTQRKHNRQRHPVHDFLFEYYPFRRPHLRQWHPGVAVALQDGAEYQSFDAYEAVVAGNDAVTTVRSDCFLNPVHRDFRRIRMIATLLQGTANRSPRFSCFGMHEWAMVLGQTPQQVRHQGVPLRVSQHTIDQTLTDLGLTCSHFDAYRFFTPEALPRNAWVLDRASQADLDQPGCLHVGMDLYKWAVTLQPLTSSDDVILALRLAAWGRDVDMRASPYDLSAWGYEPIAMETPAGRSVYVAQQRALATAAAPLRRRLATIANIAVTGELPADTTTLSPQWLAKITVPQSTLL